MLGETSYHQPPHPSAAENHPGEQPVERHLFQHPPYPLCSPSRFATRAPRHGSEKATPVTMNGGSSMATPTITPSRTVLATQSSYTPRHSRQHRLLEVPPGDAMGSNSIGPGSPFITASDSMVCLASSTTTSDPSNASVPTVACAWRPTGSVGQVQLYDQERLHCLWQTDVGDGKSLQNRTTDLVYGPPSALTGTSLIRSTADGTVQLYDVRCNGANNRAPAAVFGLPKNHSSTQTAALSVAVAPQASLLAVATDQGQIHFADLRRLPLQPQDLSFSCQRNQTDWLACYDQTLLDAGAVTQVAFAPSSLNLVAATDQGAVVVFDTTKPTEAAAFQSHCRLTSTSSCLKQVNFVPSQPNLVYGMTDDAFHMWDWLAAGPPTVEHVGNLIPSTATTLDYLVQAHWHGPTQQLLLLAGSSSSRDGTVAMLQRNTQQPPSHHHQHHQSSWQVGQFLTRGHSSGKTRAWCPLDGTLSSSLALLTAGDDGRLCEWNCQAKAVLTSFQQPAASASTLGDDMMMGDQEEKKHDDGDDRMEGSAAMLSTTSASSGQVHRRSHSHDGSGMLSTSTAASATAMSLSPYMFRQSKRHKSSTFTSWSTSSAFAHFQ